MRFPYSHDFVDRRMQPVLRKERPQADVKRAVRKPLRWKLLEEVSDSLRRPALDRLTRVVTDFWWPQLRDAGRKWHLLPFMCRKRQLVLPRVGPLPLKACVA